MKLGHILGIGFLGALIAAGCSSTDTKTGGDGGTAGSGGSAGAGGAAGSGGSGGSGGGSKTDGGAGGAGGSDAGKGDGGDPLAACKACQKEKCAKESMACGADPACVKRVNCINDCGTKTDPDAAKKCANQCISDIPTKAGDDFITCVQTKCGTECG